MSALRNIVRAVRHIAPHSDPIDPFERRVIGLLILAVVASAWLTIWAKHRLEEKESEGHMMRTKNIWVANVPGGSPASAPNPRSPLR